jgi:mannitol 2-dehydrogenase
MLNLLSPSAAGAFDGSSRHPGFIIPTIREGLAAGESIDGLALVEAAWARMCEGTREDGSIIEPNDPFWDDLNAKAIQAKQDPAVWLGMQHIYGDLNENAEFVESFSRWMRVIWQDGLESAISTYLET